MTDSIGVLHLVDSLDAGGAEQMAVMLANSLPVERYAAWICASRKSGSLETRLAAHVNFYNLQRRGRFDLGAILRLARLIRQENIRIIHAHTTSLFLGTVICFLNPRVQMLWHDHFGRHIVNPEVVLLVVTQPLDDVQGAGLSLIPGQALFFCIVKLVDDAVGGLYQNLGLNPFFVVRVVSLVNQRESEGQDHAEQHEEGDQQQFLSYREM